VGAANVPINNILTFGFFQQTNNCGTLAPQTFCTVQISVAPVTGGSSNGDVGIVHDGSFRDDLFASFQQNPSDGPLLLSTSSVGFGSELLNQQSVTHTITVTNTGTSAVSVSAPVLGGTKAASFSVAANTCSGISLRPQASCIVSVAFQPTVAGLLFAPMTLSTSGVTTTVTLSGTGLVPPSVSISPTSYSFGNVFLGTSGQQVFTVQNNGTASATISNIVAAMADATPAADYAEQDTCQNALAPSAACTITITFAPQATGSRNGALSMAINGGIVTLSATLSATGVFPIAASSSSLAFGQILDSTISSKQTLTLTNQTTVPQSVTASIGAPFQIVNNDCGASLAADAQCSLSIAFAPQVSGPQTSSLLVAVSGIAQQLSIALSGTGTAPIAILSTTNISFGNQTVGVSSNTQTVTLLNSGNVTLSAIAQSLSGPNASDFAVSGNCGSTLTAGASCSIVITFKPSVSAAESATLNLSSNAAGSPQTVQLAGTGVSPDFSPVAAVSSATVSAGQTATYGLSFSSTMSGTATLACSGLPLYAACIFNPSTVTLSTTAAASDTLSITTTTTQTAALSRRGWAEVMTAALLFLCVPFARRRRPFVSLLSLAALAVISGGLTGCSGSPSSGGSSTQHTVAPGSYVVNVVATSETVSHSLTVTLNIK
jgi:hypothetical protein